MEKIKLLSSKICFWVQSKTSNLKGKPTKGGEEEGRGSSSFQSPWLLLSLKVLGTWGCGSLYRVPARASIARTHLTPCLREAISLSRIVSLSKDLPAVSIWGWCEHAHALPWIRSSVPFFKNQRSCGKEQLKKNTKEKAMPAFASLLIFALQLLKGFYFINSILNLCPLSLFFFFLVFK